MIQPLHGESNIHLNNIVNDNVVNIFDTENIKQKDIMFPEEKENDNKVVSKGIEIKELEQDAVLNVTLDDYFNSKMDYTIDNIKENGILLQKENEMKHIDTDINAMIMDTNNITDNEDDYYDPEEQDNELKEEIQDDSVKGMSLDDYFASKTDYNQHNMKEKNSMMNAQEKLKKHSKDNYINSYKMEKIQSVEKENKIIKNNNQMDYVKGLHLDDYLGAKEKLNKNAHDKRYNKHKKSNKNNKHMEPNYNYKKVPNINIIDSFESNITDKKKKEINDKKKYNPNDILIKPENKIELNVKHGNNHHHSTASHIIKKKSKTKTKKIKPMKIDSINQETNKINNINEEYSISDVNYNSEQLPNLCGNKFLNHLSDIPHRIDDESQGKLPPL